MWPTFVLLGWERLAVAPRDTAFTPLAFTHYPWSHSLAMVAAWAVAAGLAYRARTRRLDAAVAVGVLVLSHWLLDFVTHRPDLPLYPGGPLLGLGLWRSVPATLAVELALCIGAGALALPTVLRPDRVGRGALAGFLGILLFINVANLLGPPPPSPRAVAWSALGLWLLVPWAAWLDRRSRCAIDESRPGRHT